MEAVLGALAHLVHDSSDTNTARERKTELRQARGLLELVYGTAIWSSIAELRERRPLAELKQSRLIGEQLRSRIEAIQDTAA